ncbi:hypothetical protein BsWGS_09438 [Bradybaena similaris]
MTKLIIIVVLILVQVVIGAEAQNIGPCIDALLNSAKSGGDICPAAEEYVRCFFVSLNVPTWSLSETELTNLENALEKNLTAIGIHCDIDISAILRKVKEDESNAATRTTNKPTGYNSATTIDDCVNAFTGATTQAGGPSCSLVTPYLKCTIRVTGLYKFDPHSSTYSDTFSSLETQIETGLRSLGLNCNFDIKELSTEVASEQNYRNSGYNDAVTIDDCVNAFTGATTQAGGPSCSLITPYLKCTIRVAGLYKFDPHSSTYSDTFSSLETQIENGLRSLGLNCNFDIKQLSAEVASEQNYKNSESGLHTSVRGMMSLYTVTVAAWICSYFFLQ